jgi:nucleoside-diphosphate-sugar epimerase
LVYDESWYSGRSVLITGGLGFIGSSLAIRMVALGAKVTLLDAMLKECGGNWKNIEPIREQVRIFQDDMRNFQALSLVVKEQDAIFHLAGQVSHGNSMREPLTDLGLNCVSTMNLVEACRIHNTKARIVFTSTRQVYGVPQTLPVKENHPVLPIDVNGINKLAAEYYHLLYHRTYNLKSTVLRLTNTYGPRLQIQNDRQGFIGVFLKQCLSGREIDIFGDGMQVRDFNYVDDVVQALVLSLLHDQCFGHIFNLGSRDRYTLLHFAQTLATLKDVTYKLIPFPVDKKLIDIGNYYGDYSAFSDITGWQPQMDFHEGLAKTLAYFQAHRINYLTA